MVEGATPGNSFWVAEAPLRWGRANFGSIRVTGYGRARPAYRQRWARRLNTICGIGACALDRVRLGQERPGDSGRRRVAETFPSSNGTIGSGQPDCGVGYPTMVRDATFLNAVLPFALGQAQRHREPLSLLCIAIDRLHGIRELLGRAMADHLVQSVGETVVSLIRATDIVARLDDDRLVAVLPRSGDQGALGLGQILCEKVAQLDWPRPYQPDMRITVSVGVATFPSSADTVCSLFQAADDALAAAQARGRNQAMPAAHISTASPTEPVIIGSAP